MNDKVVSQIGTGEAVVESDETMEDGTMSEEASRSQNAAVDDLDSDVISSPVRERELPPRGEQDAKCIAVYKLGLQSGYQGGSPRKKMVLLFELATKISSGVLAGEGHRISKIVTADLYPKSGLVKILESWLGHNPSQIVSGERKMSVSNLIGRPATLVVTHVMSNGKRMAKIVEVLPAKEGAPQIETKFNPAEIPEWIQNMREKRIVGPTKPSQARW